MDLSDYHLTKFQIKRLTPAIEDLNHQCVHCFYEILLSMSDSQLKPLTDAESDYRLDNYWWRTMWGSKLYFITMSDPDVATLSDPHIKLYNGTYVDNPFQITTDFVKLICARNHVSYQDLDNYRNLYNETVIKYGAHSKEITAIAWKPHAEDIPGTY